MQSDVIQKREAGYPLQTSPWSGGGISLLCPAPSTTTQRSMTHHGERGIATDRIERLLFLCFRYLAKRPDRLDRGWHTAVLGEVDDQLLDLVFGDAEIERAAHMDLQFGGSP